MSQTFNLKPLESTDLILKPAVGVTWLTSSDANCFKSVVLPALSRPRSKRRNSLSGFERNFLKIFKSPWKYKTYVEFISLLFLVNKKINLNQLPSLIRRISHLILKYLLVSPKPQQSFKNCLRYCCYGYNSIHVWLGISCIQEQFIVVLWNYFVWFLI